ncbi:glycine zipper 2TM domain-containing protein [Rosenbergiella australiborealis]|uniref:glycine zipper 2TM domain-containing protein n=1 Tax=Rosenbergiella australiborealis TaxID=1544696 RepID=UPI001F4ED530|nr:glycine zipper 2TM domain-containing protein [Rosenbergiella australiborealis]
MNKSLVVGVGIGVLAALGVAAVAGNHFAQPSPQFAEVIAVQPHTEIIKTPHEVCHNVNVVHRRAVQDENRITGSVLGAVAGGVLGHQFGGGHGRDIATVAGALAGGYAGNQAQQSLQNSDTYQTAHRRCSTQYTQEQRTKNYTVTYKIGHTQNTVVMDHKPGSVIPLDSHGNLKLNAPIEQKSE